jgi:hypothetical protein
MPGYTTKLKLPYPVAADTPDIPRDMKALADKLDGIIPNLETYDSRATSDVKAASSNWQIAAYHGTKVYLQVSVIIGVYYRGKTAIKGDGAGNVGDQQICTLQQTILRPQTTATGIINTADTFGWCYVDSSGRIYLRGLSNSVASLAPNEGCNITLSYPSD